VSLESRHFGEYTRKSETVAEAFLGSRRVERYDEAMGASTTALARFRRYRAVGTGFFVLLLLVVMVERRLADGHFNLRTAPTAIESDDVLDGDEIRVRLIVLNDETPPTLPPASRALGIALRPFAEDSESPALGVPAPRGPPRPLPAS
jgi:hypothetical protein